MGNMCSSSGVTGQAGAKRRETFVLFVEYTRVSPHRMSVCIHVAIFNIEVPCVSMGGVHSHWEVRRFVVRY